MSQDFEEGPTKEQAKKASEALNQAMSVLADIDIDSDFAGYLFLTTGFSLMLAGNSDDAVRVTKVTAQALMAASMSAEEDDDDDDEEEEIMH